MEFSSSNDSRLGIRLNAFRKSTDGVAKLLPVIFNFFKPVNMNEVQATMCPFNSREQSGASEKVLSGSLCLITVSVMRTEHKSEALGWHFIAFYIFTQETLTWNLAEHRSRTVSYQLRYFPVLVVSEYLPSLL